MKAKILQRRKDASAQGLLEGPEREQGDSGDVKSNSYDDYDADVDGDSITTTDNNKCY